MVEPGYLCQEMNSVQKKVGLDSKKQDQASESILIGALTGMGISTIMTSFGSD